MLLKLVGVGVFLFMGAYSTIVADAWWNSTKQTVELMQINQHTQSDCDKFLYDEEGTQVHYSEFVSMMNMLLSEDTTYGWDSMSDIPLSFYADFYHAECPNVEASYIMEVFADYDVEISQPSFKYWKDENKFIATEDGTLDLPLSFTLDFFVDYIEAHEGFTMTVTTE